MTEASTTALARRLRAFSWADAVILVTVLIWGINMVVVKALLVEIPPLAFTALRFVGAAVLETLILFATGQNLSMPWRDLRRMIAMSLFGVVAYQVLFVFGITRTTAGNSSVLLATVPIFVLLYNGLMRRQRLAGIAWLGAIMTCAGVLFLTLGRGQALAAQWATLTGDLLILLAAIGWAAYTLSSQPLLRVYSPLKLTTLSMLVTAPALVLLAIPELLTLPWSEVTPGAWAGLAYSAVFSIALAYLLWNVSVQRLGGTRTAIYSNLTPIISLVAAWLALGERLGLLQLAGVLIVLVGVGLARVQPRRPDLALGGENEP